MLCGCGYRVMQEIDWWLICFPCTVHVTRTQPQREITEGYAKRSMSAGFALVWHNSSGQMLQTGKEWNRGFCFIVSLIEVQLQTKRLVQMIRLCHGIGSGIASCAFFCIAWCALYRRAAQYTGRFCYSVQFLTAHGLQAQQPVVDRTHCTSRLASRL
jgi:hypothetical protein